MQTKIMGDAPYYFRTGKCTKPSRKFNAWIIIKGLATESEGSSPKRQPCSCFAWLCWIVVTIFLLCQMLKLSFCRFTKFTLSNKLFYLFGKSWISYQQLKPGWWWILTANMKLLLLSYHPWIFLHLLASLADMMFHCIWNTGMNQQLLVKM